MAEIVNPIPVEEVGAWVKPAATAFLRDRDGAETAGWTRHLTRTWDPARAWGAREAGRWVATLRTEPRALAVPGDGPETTHDITADALTGVTVAATHRRRGLMGRMLSASLAGARERGEPVSILIAAEWPIYGRFGYAPATLSADYELRSSRAGATVDGDPSRLAPVERTGFARVAPAVFETARRRRAGQIDRGGGWWERMLGSRDVPGLPTNWLVHEGDDGPDGLLGWRPTRDFGLIPPLGEIEVWLLMAAGDTAYRNIWAYLTGIDVVEKVHLRQRPVDEPARWLLRDGRSLVATQLADFTWLRIIDVPAALSARSYAIDGSLVLDVRDETPGGFAAGRFRLQVEGGSAVCARTGAEPDVIVDQRALASIYLGGFRLAELPADLAVERRPGARERLGLMFSTPRVPWNATWF